MRQYKTRRSTYEVEGPCIRRVTGLDPTSPLGIPDGEWLEFSEVFTTRIADATVLVGRAPEHFELVTSRVLWSEEVFYVGFPALNERISGDEVCMAIEPAALAGFFGHICTRAEGHSGPHVADGVREIKAVWR